MSKLEIKFKKDEATINIELAYIFTWTTIVASGGPRS